MIWPNQINQWDLWITMWMLNIIWSFFSYTCTGLLLYFLLDVALFYACRLNQHADCETQVVDIIILWNMMIPHYIAIWCIKFFVYTNEISLEIIIFHCFKWCEILDVFTMDITSPLYQVLQLQEQYIHVHKKVYFSTYIALICSIRL